MRTLELEQRSEAWRQWRLQGITATESGVILGQNPYTTPWRLWCEKTGRAEPEDLLRQISVSRSLKSEGIILFDWAHLPVKYQNALRYRVFLPKGAKAAKLKFK